MRDDQPDFPAAHSMDTTWFAVDADGHLGLFSSDAEGAVPASVRGEDSADNFLNGLMTDAAEFLWRSGRVEGRHCVESQASADYDLFDVLLFLSQPPNFPNEPDWSKRTVRPVLGGDGQVLHAVWATCVDSADYQSVHAQGLCAGCCSVDSLEDAHRLGLFYYDCKVWGPNPYERVAVPQQPLKLDDLPTGLQATCRPVNLPSVRFVLAERVQPLEHLPCRTWGYPETFGSSDGHTRVPMPPKVD